MPASLSFLGPYLWIVGAVLAVIVIFVVVRFFWQHVLRYVVRGCLVVVGSLLLLAILKFFKVF